MNINLKGVTRIVIVLDHTVIKIPNFTHSWNHFLRGLIGNISESQTWKWNSGKYEKGTSYLLCPVLWCSWGGWVLIMRKANLLTEADWEKVKIPLHKKHFKGDDTLSNYGMIEGRVVKIDYGELDDHWGEDFKPD